MSITQNSLFARILILIVGCLIGLFVAAQARVQPVRVINPVSPFVALREARAALLKEEGALEEEVKKLTNEINITQQSIEKNTSVSKEIVAHVEQLRASVGLTEVE